MHTQEWFTNGSEQEGRESGSEVKKRNVHSPLPSGQTLFPETHSGMDRGFGASGGVKPRSIFLVSRKLCTAAATKNSAAPITYYFRLTSSSHRFFPPPPSPFEIFLTTKHD